MPKTTKPKKNVKVCKPVVDLSRGGNSMTRPVIDPPKLRKVEEENCDDSGLPVSVCWCDECITGRSVEKIKEHRANLSKKTNWYYLLALLIGTLLVLGYSYGKA